MFSHLPSRCNALVIGASGGIGAALCDELQALAQVERLYGVSRRGQGPATFNLAADLATDEGRAELARWLAGQPLHLVINTLGLLHGEGIWPEKRIEDVSAEALLKSALVNAFSPALCLQALWPNLTLAKNALVGHLSARVGSIADNRLGGWYSYRAAKAAQNQLNRTLAIELGRRLPGVWLLTLHPGTTISDLSTPFLGNTPKDKQFSPQRAARQLLQVLAGAGAQHHGGFWAWDGQPIPW